MDRWETTDGERGRIEVRRHAVSREVAWLSSERRFPGLAAIAMVEDEVERHGQTSRERRYFLSSAALDARLFAHAVRCRWHSVAVRRKKASWNTNYLEAIIRQEA